MEKKSSLASFLPPESGMSSYDIFCLLLFIQKESRAEEEKKGRRIHIQGFHPIYDMKCDVF